VNYAYLAPGDFRADAVFFANSAGTHYFWNRRLEWHPTQLAPISEEKIDEAKLRLENIIRTSIEPYYSGAEDRMR